MLEPPPSKDDLRSALRVRRSGISASQQQDAAELLDKNLARLPAWQTAQRVALFLSSDGEIDTSTLLASAQSQGKRVYLPVITDDNSLEFALHDTGVDMQENRYGIPEPPATAARIAVGELGLIGVPLVAFDEHCNRLGMGGGYYDRALANVDGPLRVGLAFDCQRVPHIPTDTWDVPLDFVVTEAALYTRRDGPD